MKLFLSLALVSGAASFAPMPVVHSSTALGQHKLGSGGMADTRDPDTYVDEDPRKSISAAPSFEEYLKQRAAAAGGAPAATAAAAPAAPVASAAAPVASSGGVGGGGDVLGTLSTLQGPGQVWGDLGIAQGHEESDLRGYDNFGKFYSALNSLGVASELQGAGPFTIFAPTDPALESYETMRGPLTADVLKLHIVKGKISSKDVPTTPLVSLGGVPLKYRYAVRKHFVNDAVIGEKTFGPYSDYPIDVECSNGIIHAVSLCFAM
ncbi:hypothetical protein ACHAXA_007121 [Cyclostephanos tholiformis]|uniref:FAS1 domain-containing protein n=1 Tax=Cyclostephanos tholiformis TaxID=382380 RepID=A0ABD3RYI3_9STRA